MKIRPALSSDVNSAVPLIYSSGPAAFNYVFSRNKSGSAQEFLHRAFISPSGEFGYENHIVVEQDSEVVGIGAAYDGSTGIPFLLAAIKQIALHYKSSALPVMIRGLQVESIVQPPKGKMHYIAHLGVKPAMQSKGVGSALIEYLIEQGKTQGKTLAALDVSLQNPRAQALYEKLGFNVVAHKPSTLKTVPDHYRMEKII